MRPGKITLNNYVLVKILCISHQRGEGQEEVEEEEDAEAKGKVSPPRVCRMWQTILIIITTDVLQELFADRLICFAAHTVDTGGCILVDGDSN